jgi:hypothetical protein
VKKDWITLVSEFRDLALPKSAWTHEMHLVVALWYLLKYKDIHSALCYLRANIVLYNHSVGIQNTALSGYHETITVFWVIQLKGFLDSESSTEFAVLVKKLLNSHLIRKDYIFRFYRKELLKSPRARGFYVIPS